MNEVSTEFFLQFG